jgi:ABC-2 type transport system permease protein
MIMRTIRYILIKEFKQIFRNRAMLPIIFIAPVIQLLILSFAVDYEIKNLKLWIVDHDQSEFSRKLIHRFTSSGYFIVVGNSHHHKAAFENLERENADLSLLLPQNFERDIIREGQADVQVVFNAIDGTKAGLASNYANSIILQFNAFLLEYYGIKSNLNMQGLETIEIENSYWYNPDLNYQAFMVPGILVILVTMIGMMLSAMNIVREKEIGTIEQINVTPIKKYHFILGKTLPFWIIALFDLAIGLVVGKLVFNIPIVGSLFTLYAFAGVYLLVVLGLGLYISTITDTQQQAMFLTWFVLVIFILLGGLFTAVENMPLWAQKITLLNPIRYFIEVIRMVLLKGAGFREIGSQFLIMMVFAIAINTLAILRYRKTSG